MFIAPTKAFAHLGRLAAWQAGEKPAPVTVEWDLSNRCHLGCEWCHFAHTHTRGPWVSRERRLPMAYDGTGDLADVDLVKRGLRDMREAGVQGVVWSGGGEPTVHPRWLEIVEAAASVGMQQGMYTAGSLLKPVQARALASMATWVVVSLDAAHRQMYRDDKGVDAFDAASQGIRELALAGSAAIGVSFLLNRSNWSAAPAMLRLARDLGPTYTTFRPAIDTSPDEPSVCLDNRRWVREAMPMLEWLEREPDVEMSVPRFLEYLEWRGREYQACHGIKLNATITPDGRVWVCPQRRGIPGSEIGDLRVESFADLWQRHPGQWTEFANCRVMCRLHMVNSQIAPIFESYAHQEFV